jgi:hypothetical protein
MNGGKEMISEEQLDGCLDPNSKVEKTDQIQILEWIPSQ